MAIGLGRVPSIWPQYNRDIAILLGQRKGLSPLHTKELLVRQTLLMNFSMLAEWRFRKNLQAVLTDWNRKQLAYDEARVKINELISNRSPFAKRVIPCYCLAQLLVAFGFFSSAAMLVASSRVPSYPVTYRGFVALREILRQAPRRHWRPIISDIRKLGQWRFERFSGHSLGFVSTPRSMPVKPSKTLQNILFLGPSPISFIPEQAFSRTLVLLNESSSPNALSLPSNYGAIDAMFRGRMSRRILSGQLDPSWTAALADVDQIHADLEYGPKLEAVLGRQVSTERGNLEFMWGARGNPNLAQVALGLYLDRFSISEPPRLHLEGVTLYASPITYSESEEFLGVQDNPTPFRVCQALANHDPVINFQVTRGLLLAGIITGGSEVSEILELATRDYLLRLDENVGRRRK